MTKKNKAGNQVRNRNDETILIDIGLSFKPASICPTSMNIKLLRKSQKLSGEK